MLFYCSEHMQKRELNTCKQDIYSFLHFLLPTNPRPSLVRDWRDVTAWFIGSLHFCIERIGNEKATVYFQLIARKYRISNNLLQDTKNFPTGQILFNRRKNGWINKLLQWLKFEGFIFSDKRCPNFWPFCKDTQYTGFRQKKN